MLCIGSNFVDLRRGGSPGNSGLFFDPVTEQVCTIRTEEKGNESEFNVCSLDSNRKGFTFRTRERGHIRTICFSPDRHLASIQQEDTVVDFILLSAEAKVEAEFRQICKSKGAIILGLHWLSERQIVFVTDAGCEFYTITAHRRTVKLTKSISHSVNWFSYYPPSKLFVFASGIPNNVLMFMSYQNGVAHNIGKFELNFGQSSVKPRLLERDIVIAPIYGIVCLLALKFEAVNGFATGLNIFEFPTCEAQPQPPKLKFTLRLDLIGLVGVQVLDNLVLIHHKNAQKSLLFDIRISTERPLHSSPLWLHPNLAQALQRQQPKQGGSGQSQAEAAATFLYNSAWKMSSLGGFVIDLHQQIFTRVELDLAMAVELMGDLEQTIQFLTNRSNTEQQLLELVQRLILKKEMKFTRLTQLLRQILHDPTSVEEAKTCKWLLCPASFSPLAVNHNSILRSIFEPLYQHPGVDKCQLANLMVDFFLCLKQRKIQIKNHYMPELLLKIVADAKMWTCLQQLLQYRVIEDSKFLAFELISLSAECPALYQVALDMLSRRGNSEQIAEVLLGRGHILEALRFIGDEYTESGSQRLDKLCLKLIEAAWRTRDRPLMYTVFSHLLAVGRLKTLAEGSANEDFERLSKEFELLYGEQELSEAEQRFRLARLSSIRRRSQRFDSFTSSMADDEDQLLRDIQADAGSSTSTAS